MVNIVYYRRVIDMYIKIVRLLLKIEKWFLNRFIYKDTLEYEDYLYTIKDHENNMERIYHESQM